MHMKLWIVCYFLCVNLRLGQHIWMLGELFFPFWNILSPSFMISLFFVIDHYYQSRGFRMTVAIFNIFQFKKYLMMYFTNTAIKTFSYKKYIRSFHLDCFQQIHTSLQSLGKTVGFGENCHPNSITPGSAFPWTPVWGEKGKPESTANRLGKSVYPTVYSLQKWQIFKSLKIRNITNIPGDSWAFFPLASQLFPSVGLWRADWKRAIKLQLRTFLLLWNRKRKTKHPLENRTVIFHLNTSTRFS